MWCFEVSMNEGGHV